MNAAVRIADETPKDTVESLLQEELKSLHDEIQAMVDSGLSEEDAKGLLDWAKALEGKIKAVAAVLSNPSPEAVSAYLRFVASGIDSTRSRRFAASGLRLLRAALSRSAR